MTEQNTEFEGIIEHLSDPLRAKKASLLNTISILLFFTWLAVIVPVTVKVWAWGF